MPPLRGIPQWLSFLGNFREILRVLARSQEREIGKFATK
jgi:hypothetical protein